MQYKFLVTIFICCAGSISGHKLQQNNNLIYVAQDRLHIPINPEHAAQQAKEKTCGRDCTLSICHVPICSQFSLRLSFQLNAVSMLYQPIKEASDRVGSGWVGATTRGWGREIAMRRAEIQLLGAYIETSSRALLKSS